MAEPIVRETGWARAWVIGSLSLALLISGLASPSVGRLIHRFGGRPVLTAGAVLLAAGLLMLALAPNLYVFVAAWCVIGLGMAASLYDPAFSALGRLYGEEARHAIAHVTLFGGLASTVCWPLSALFVEHFGWRGAALAYAAINMAVVFPLYLLALPREAAQPLPRPARSGPDAAEPASAVERRWMFVVFALSLTTASVITTILAVHLLALLQARGLSLEAAVALGALTGPAQVAARLFVVTLGRRQHPILSYAVATVVVALGLAALLGSPSLAAVGLIFYGAGNGIRSIARGTVPLAFGREGYAIVMGWLAVPVLLAQAASPSLGGFLIDWAGPDGTLVMLVGAAAFNIVFVLMLLPFVRRPAFGAA